MFDEAAISQGVIASRASHKRNRRLRRDPERAHSAGHGQCDDKAAPVMIWVRFVALSP